MDEVAALRSCLLDVSLLCALCSQVTNGDPFSPTLEAWATTNDQRKLALAHEQRTRPSGVEAEEDAAPNGGYGALGSLLGILAVYEEWLVSASVRQGFEKILATVGGGQEKARWEQWKKRLRVVDDALPAEGADGGDAGGGGVRITGIKKDHRRLVATAEAHRAVLATANAGLVRKADAQGRAFPVALCPPQWLAGE